MTRNPPDLSRRINDAVSAAVSDAMRAYATELLGQELPPLVWSLTPSWALNAYAGPDYAQSEVAEVLARWAQTLGLTQAETSPNMAGSLTYAGEVEGRPVMIWAVTDRTTWERGGDTP